MDYNKFKTQIINYGDRSLKLLSIIKLKNLQLIYSLFNRDELLNLNPSNLNDIQSKEDIIQEFIFWIFEKKDLWELENYFLKYNSYNIEKSIKEFTNLLESLQVILYNFWIEEYSKLTGDEKGKILSLLGARYDNPF